VLLARTPLHAARLALPHPIRGSELDVAAPLPADIATTLDALRGGSTGG
jgi:tRNA pseudouridine32 synthase/23S rRNA pseudouridine746 synthase